MRATFVMQQPAAPTRARLHVGPQVAVLLLVLLAIFALPCCPRVDGWFGAAQARAADAVAVATTNSQHHAGHQHHAVADTSGNQSEGLHKGHLMTTAAVEVLPSIMPIALAALIPLARMGTSRVARLAPPMAPRIPVPPPRPAS